MSDIEIRKAADEYWSATLIEKSDGLDSYHLGVLDAFAAGAKWARAQWPITPQMAHEDRIDAWVGSLEGQANRNYRELMAMLEAINKAVVLNGLAAVEDTAKTGRHIGGVSTMLAGAINELTGVVQDVGQKVEAVISLVDDLDELIRSEDDKPEEARPNLGGMMDVLETDEAYRPAVGMFGIGGDASVVTPLRPVVMGVDTASPDDDATVASVRDAEGRTHPLMPPRWAGSILDVFIHNNQLYVRCERTVFVHFGGQHLIPMQFGA